MPTERTVRLTNIAEGQVIGGNKYRLERCVGVGGMGRVFSAKHILFEKMVAIKFMNRELIGSEEAERMFIQEAKNCAELAEDNNNIVKVADVTRDASGVYIVMELLDGCDLDRLIRDQPLPPGRAVTLMTQMCTGLETAHQRGIIHRDLKPANVFIERPGPGERAKILDFGLSKHISMPSRTETGVLKGTPLYMSPEQYQSSPLSARTDVWALGVILYQMLTGDVPFMAENVYQLGRRVVDTHPPPPRAIRSELDPALDSIVMRCLAKDPAQRFATAPELREALLDASRIDEQLAALSRGSRGSSAAEVLQGLVALRQKYPGEGRIHQKILEHHNRWGAYQLAVEAYEEARRAEALSADVLYQAAVAYQGTRNVQAEAKTLELALRAGLHPKLETPAKNRLKKLREES